MIGTFKVVAKEDDGKGTGYPLNNNKCILWRRFFNEANEKLRRRTSSPAIFRTCAPRA